MGNSPPSFRIRTAVPSDTKALCEILNAIIAVGGMTAMESALSTATFNNYFLEGESFLLCLVAEDPITSLPLGFQGLNRHMQLPENWADIGTFTRSDPKTPGVGTALFAETKAWATKHKLTAINAAIRADNRGGLAYYEKMGFRTYQIVKAVPLRDGTPVDRIFKEFVVGNHL
jgi:GNAT superfamily N-acetyltransferase